MEIIPWFITFNENIFNGIPWSIGTTYSMEIHGCFDLHGFIPCFCPWKTIESGVPILHGIPWNSMEILWQTMENPGMGSMKINLDTICIRFCKYT